MPRAFQIIAQICVGLAIAVLSMVFWKPVGASRVFKISLAFLVLAFVASLVRHYLLRSPIPVRGGALVTIDGSPVGYRVWYLFALSFSGFLLYVLLHSLV